MGARRPRHPEPLTWTLTLNEGIEFGGGAPFDGAALAALLTFQLTENPDLAAALPGATAAATGPLEAVLTTSRPAPNVPSLLADESMVPVYDVAAYRRHRESGADAAALVGAGLYTAPYVVDSLDADAMQLSPDPDHWAGPPALDDLTVRFVPEVSARIQAVQAGRPTSPCTRRRPRRRPCRVATTRSSSPASRSGRRSSSSSTSAPRPSTTRSYAAPSTPQWTTTSSRTR